MARIPLSEEREKNRHKNKARRVQLSKTLRKNNTANFSWSGEWNKSPAYAFLVKELGIDVQSLTSRQLEMLERDAQSITFEYLTAIRDKAKRDSPDIKPILSRLKKLEQEIQVLSPELWNGKAAESHPAHSLLNLQINLEEHQFLVQQELGILKSGKENLASRALCINAIQIWLRWKGNFGLGREHGVDFPYNWGELLKISKSEGLTLSESHPVSPLSSFLEFCTLELKEHIEEWDFNYYEPSREAAAVVAKDLEKSK